MRMLNPILAALFLATLASAQADTIAIIGTGNVARALGPEFAAQGHEIVYGSRNPSTNAVRQLVEDTGDAASATTQIKAASQADIVVLAVPGMLVEEITKSLGDLSGKIIIDPTNPLKKTSLGFEHAVTTSNAEIIQKAAPGAYVVKAFNTLNWKTMIDPDESGGPVSIPLVGNSDSAKETVAKLIDGMGLEAIDLGGIENAHWVEGMLILWINNRYGSERESFDFHLRKND
ncbi:MAG: NADPH-dependent F420 reductase [Gammaproteobacteria bacterium]|nr:NADPH-dependent F420 reductase [Gammaproteobacteria bacterium]MDH3429011.1 NADPH-dependent F420 reductase [Gammaproteobacteria bacterium]